MTTNMTKVNELLKELNWESIVIKRHHKFIKRYLELGSLKDLGSFYGFSYSESDLLQIFSRIQKQLEPYSKNYKPVVEKVDHGLKSIKAKNKSNRRPSEKLVELVSIVEKMPNWNQHLTEYQVKSMEIILKWYKKGIMLSWAEIAEKEGISSTTIQGALSKTAYDKLKKVLKETA